MRILVLQFKRIGDVILTTPLLAALRIHFPGCDLTIAQDESTAALGPALDVDHLLVFRRGVAGISFWRRIAAGGYDVCIDVTGNDRSAVATALSRAKHRITWARISKKPLRSVVYNTYAESSVKSRHTADHHTDLLRPLGVEVKDVPLSLTIPRIAQDEADHAITNAGIRVPYVIVHAGTARAEKYWLPERWAAVIEAIRDEFGMPVILTGSTDSAEQTHLDAIQRALRTPCLNLAGCLSLLGTAAAIRKAALLCAVDSAPVHLADAVETPLVALFGPTNPFHWRPRRASSHIVTASGEEILTPDYPKGSMGDIRAATVITAIQQLLR